MYVMMALGSRCVCVCVCGTGCLLFVESQGPCNERD